MQSWQAEQIQVENLRRCCAHIRHIYADLRRRHFLYRKVDIPRKCGAAKPNAERSTEIGTLNSPSEIRTWELQRMIWAAASWGIDQAVHCTPELSWLLFAVLKKKEKKRKHRAMNPTLVNKLAFSNHIQPNEVFPPILSHIILRKVCACEKYKFWKHITVEPQGWFPVGRWQECWCRVV